MDSYDSAGLLSSVTLLCSSYSVMLSEASSVAEYFAKSLALVLWESFMVNNMRAMPFTLSDFLAASNIL